MHIDYSDGPSINELFRKGLPAFAYVVMERKTERWHDGISWAPPGLYVNMRETDTSAVRQMLLKKQTFERSRDPEMPERTGSELCFQVWSEIRKHFEQTSDDLWILEIEIGSNVGYLLCYIGGSRVTGRDLLNTQTYLLEQILYPF